jgi:hypothetical protein
MRLIGKPANPKPRGFLTNIWSETPNLAGHHPFQEFFPMKIQIFAAISVSLIALCACSDDSSPTGSQSASGRIQAGLVGTWIDNSSLSPDTIIFAENKIQVPYFSAVGTQFSAKNGQVKGGPDNNIFGEFLLSGDTLYYDALLGGAPDGVNKATADIYLKK